RQAKNHDLEADDGRDQLRAPRPFPSAHEGACGPRDGPMGLYCAPRYGVSVSVLLGPLAVGVDVAQGDFHMLIDFIIDSIRGVLLEDADVISRHRRMLPALGIRFTPSALTMSTTRRRSNTGGRSHSSRISSFRIASICGASAIRCALASARLGPW